MSETTATPFADVVLACSPYLTLTYRIPEAFSRDMQPGLRVRVPLGRRQVTGMVIRLLSRTPVENPKPIDDVLDVQPVLSPDLIGLTEWVADYYLAEWGEVIRAALPSALVQETKLMAEPVEIPTGKTPALSEAEQSLLDRIRLEKNKTVRSLAKQWGRGGIYHALARLEKAGLIRVTQRLEKSKAAVRTEKWISLKRAPDSKEMESLRKKARRQAEVLTELQRLGGEIRRTDIDADLPTLRRLEKTGWIEIWEEEVFRDGYRDVESEPFVPHPLTAAQREALGQIEACLKSGAFGVFLVHGVTASGKTRLYIEATRYALAMGKSVLVLIPEISLTPQAVARYRGAFGNQVAVLHSGLSPGERLDSWKALRVGSCRIALGPRSAVFAPLSNLGLIVVDEEHESSYKQNDPVPRYNARDAAVMRGKILSCTVLLGSATPSLESYHNALSGKYRLCRLPERMDGVPMPTVALADPREYRKDHPVFTPMLEEEIRKRLDRKEQAILLLNRRGYANFLQCGACGAIETCPHCAISLTFHLKQRSLRCHYCGFTKPASDLCPACGGSRIRYRGLGTERVEEELRSRFPDARLLRMDMDTTRRKGAHARIVEDFGKHKSDLLLGTQMVAKGHDFPGVTLVGIVSADTGLYFPDFRSGERTFQLLTQAAGRAGRKDVPGEVVIQTATPDHPAILFAQKQDYETFYKWAAEQRREFQYPPFGRLVLVGFRCPDAKKALDAATQFFEWTPMHGVERLGPVPAPLSLIQGQHRFHILYRQSKDLDPSGKALRDKIRNAIRRFRESDRFRNVRIHADVDPMDLM